VLTGRLHQAFVLLASWALAASAHASYGQMRLDGLGLLVVFALTVAYGVLVDLALFARIFRYRAALVIGSIAGLGVVFLLLSQVATPGEWAGFFKGHPGGAWLVILVVTGAVFLPFIVIAPLAQYLAMRHGRRWPGWITAWMALQLALLPGFLVLAGTEQYFWQKEYAAGQAVGREAGAGALAAILVRAEQRQERIWGTGWTYPRQQKPSAGYAARRSAWIRGLAKGMDATALMAANEPLGASDRAALRTLTTQHYYASPNTRAKLLWDALEPGSFSRQLTPRGGVHEVGTVDEEVIPVLLERLEKYGAARLCPGGRMMDADRAVLNALVVAKGRVWNVATRAHEMSPQWESYQRRVERLCRGPV
jgi:hypothetical protein